MQSAIGEGREEMSDDGIGTLPVMTISDMRAGESFQVGDRVSCPGGECGSGIIVRIDPDYRLARVEWPKGKIGWWYLKDLTLTPAPLPRKRAREMVDLGLRMPYN
jgi:hypothetical protein